MIKASAAGELLFTVLRQQRDAFTLECQQSRLNEFHLKQYRYFILSGWRTDR